MNKIKVFVKKYKLHFTCMIITLLALAATGITLMINGDQVLNTFVIDPPPTSYEEVKITFSRPYVAEVSDIKIQGNLVSVTYKALSSGTTKASMQVTGHQVSLPSNLKVNSMGLIMDTGNGNIGGYRILILIIGLWFISLSITLLWFFRENISQKLYSYQVMYCDGFGIFLLTYGLSYLYLYVKAMLDPELYTGFSAISLLMDAKWTFLFIGMPFIIIFAAGMAISNIVLMRHEGVRPQNALGIGIGIALILGEGIALILYGYIDLLGNRTETMLIVAEIFCSVYIYFACLLIGAIACGINAAKHEPPLDRDFILILGCGIRPDGGLYPLIQGRVDRAVAFYRKQLTTTGKAPILMPSGGQGKDEICSEAEAMKRYLIECCNVPESHIMTEAQSSTTFENMTFSKKIIDKHQSKAKTAFSTTNFHVFRSGILSQRVKLNAEGMGAPTKWYFWPNAFMREVVGLIAEKWILVLSLFVAFVLLYVIQIIFLPM